MFIFFVCVFILYFIEWKRIMNASSAATLFRRVILREQQLEIPLRFKMDLHSDVEEREKAVIAFYKTQRTKWASPLHCVLEGKNVSLNF